MNSEQKKSKIYFDANAGAPLASHVREGLSALLRESPEVFSNPSSIHSSGRIAKKTMREATDSIATSLGARPSDLIFTSCGSEANQLAIRSFVEAMGPTDGRSNRFHFITSKVEHDCIRDMIPWVESQGGRISYLPLSSSGAPDISVAEELIRESDISSERTLISVIWVNNETGLITPLPSQILGLLKKRNVRIHLDAAQAWGKVVFSVSEMLVDTMAFAGHKLGSLSGVGVLWARDRSLIRPTVFGGQQRSQRGGTENTAGIASLGLAVRNKSFVDSIKKVQALTTAFEASLMAEIPGAKIHGRLGDRVGNTSYFCIDGINKVNWVQLLDVEGIQVSSGAACSAALPEPSHVLLEMGIPFELARSSVRVSFSDLNTLEEVEQLVQTLSMLVKRVTAK